MTGSREIPYDADGVVLNFNPPFRRINFIDELESKLGERLPDFESANDPTDALLKICESRGVHVPTPHTVSRILDKLISHFVEPECIQPTFLCGHPLAMSPLAKAIVDEKV